MKHFFILGRNPELSRAELLSYLNARKRTHKEILFEKNLLVLETNEGEHFDIQEFGGILKIGEINFEGNSKELQDYLKQNEVIPSDKFSYAVFGNGNVEILKEKFKNEKRKAVLKHGRRTLSFQNGEEVKLPNAEFDLFFQESKGKVYLGIRTQKYDYTKVKERDMEKPIRREHLAISPRLSKILINLSGAKPHDLLLDPFCGVGGILQEALLKKINVYGIDNNTQAIKDSRKNLEWLRKNYDIKTKQTLENINSKKTPDLQFKAIATETPLGKILRKKANNNESKQIIRNFEGFIIPILLRLKKCKKPSARIAITFPTIRNFRVNFEKIADKTGLKIVQKPILESKPNQFISRDILVFV